jgi:hypothetical protein
MRLSGLGARPDSTFFSSESLTRAGNRQLTPDSATVGQLYLESHLHIIPRQGSLSRGVWSRLCWSLVAQAI